MAVECRNGRAYYYTTRRVGGRVVREYGGSGADAGLAAQLDQVYREQRECAAWGRRREFDRLRLRNRQWREWLIRVAAAVADGLRAAGWHQHRREWRKKRGTNMGALVKAPTPEQARSTWHPGTLTALAGDIDAATQAAADRGDPAAGDAVAGYVAKNPAAALLWGDMGRRLLQRWVKLYAGDCLTTERAVWAVASDLRTRLAGPNPAALDLLVAERVVIGWVFAHWAEAQYALSVVELTVAQSKFYLARIEMAHRNLMSACRTLAKVKKAKLPDVLALVNVNPPHGNAAGGWH